MNTNGNSGTISRRRHRNGGLGVGVRRAATARWLPPLFAGIRAPILAAALALTPATAHAQLIDVKTVPVAAGDQFLIFPSRNLAMGGVSIALDDPLGDPFVNPAKGARLAEGRLFASPTFYGISDENGAGRTLPAAALLASRHWFGGFSLALQQLEAARRLPFVIIRPGPWWDGAPQRLSEKSANNVYAFAMLGRSFGAASDAWRAGSPAAAGGLSDRARRHATGSPATIAGLDAAQGNGATRGAARTSVAASAFWAGLDAVDGVELLYALSSSIEQSGHMADYRLGVLHEWEGDRAVEVLVLHDRFAMTHDVTYLDWVRDTTQIPGVRRVERVEQNLDRTNTTGVHLRYAGPLGHAGWRIGAVVTANRKSHPKIPNYEIMNIPRDPGHSWAYNLGAGFARTTGPVTVGLDLVYEPIWTESWAQADTAVKTASGRVIPEGEKTVENEFFFSNAHIRAGLARDDRRLGFQLGLAVRSIRYQLEQYSHVEERKRDQEESWMEWTPSWGLALKFPELEIRYLGRLTTGTGRPGVAWTGARGIALAEARAADFIVAPSGPLTLQDAHVLTHQIAVSLPLR